MKKAYLYILFICLSPLVLSVLSQFNLISPYLVTFDVATMLTPVGIFKNYLWQDTVLTPYYSHLMQQTGRDKNLWMFGYMFLQLAVALLVLRQLGRQR